MAQRLNDAARQLAGELRTRKVRIVFAESCTAGLLSATLSQVPGISEFLCGSAVTYRDATKAAWLGVSEEDLADPRIGAVSLQIAEQMCLGVLQTTSEADVAASVTGHLGPNAPENLDGIIYIGIVSRSQRRPVLERRRLTDDPDGELSLRGTRQREAAVLVYEAVLRFLTQNQR